METLKEVNDAVGNELILMAGKMHAAGSKTEAGNNIITKDDITQFVNAGADVVLLPAPGTGLESLAAGTTDIGNSSRALKDEEKEDGLVENIVAIDGIAVATNPENKVDELTSEELKQIYTGEITNWKELGGDDQSIVVIGREAGSGTRGAFEEVLEIVDACKYAQELNETGAVIAKVSSTPGAIGYVSLDILNDTVKAFKVDGVSPTEATVKDGSYALQRPFVMATKGEVSKQSKEIQAVFDYLKSDAGKKLIEDIGLVYPE
ncbi:MAG: phosphate ABC transporter substrate-binding protein [Coprobacillaceae bacterium]